MATEKKYLKAYFSSRETGAFVDGLVVAGWLAAEVEVVEEQGDNPWSKTQYVVYHRIEKPEPKPTTPRRRFIR